LVASNLALAAGSTVTKGPAPVGTMSGSVTQAMHKLAKAEKVTEVYQQKDSRCKETSPNQETSNGSAGGILI
jgi:hypothetical protein